MSEERKHAKVVVKPAKAGGYTVVVNGHDLSDYITGLELAVDGGEVPMVNIYMPADVEVEVPADLEIYLVVLDEQAEDDGTTV